MISICYFLFLFYSIISLPNIVLTDLKIRKDQLRVKTAEQDKAILFVNALLVIITAFLF